jgi:hypothetical protein
MGSRGLYSATAQVLSEPRPAAIHMADGIAVARNQSGNTWHGITYTTGASGFMAIMSTRSVQRGKARQQLGPCHAADSQ